VTAPRRVLVIEDNKEIAELVRLHLVDLPCLVDVAGDGLDGLKLAEAGVYDLVILDLMLPGMNGLDICKRLRAREAYTPILMITSKASEFDRVLGLELGADDYLTKPFSIIELMARVKAIFRRVDAMEAAPAKRPKKIVAGDLEIDFDRRHVTLAGATIELTAKEFDLLAFFASNPGRVFKREQLLDKVWGYSHSGYEHTVNAHINRLRAKIEKDSANPRFILTVWSVGYRFAEDLVSGQATA
jgi:DNA-binding response OmpR family regulator